MINGEHKSGSGRSSFKSVNPANSKDMIGIFQNATRSDLDAAISVASDALQQWQNKSVTEFGLICVSLLRCLSDWALYCVMLLSRECGLSRRKSMLEMQDILGLLEKMVSEDYALMYQRPQEDFLLSKLHVLYGSDHLSVTCQFMELLKRVFSGACVVWIPCPDQAVSAYVLAHLFDACLPPGVLNLIYADHETSRQLALTDLPGQAHKLFLKPEIKPSLIVLDERDINLAVRESLDLAYGYSKGHQTTPCEIFVHKDVFETFRKQLFFAVNDLVMGDPVLNHESTFGPLQSETDLSEALACYQKTKKTEAEFIWGKGRMSRDNKPSNFVGDPDQGFYLWPVILHIKLAAKIARKDPWMGPFMVLVEFDALDGLSELADVVFVRSGEYVFRDLKPGTFETHTARGACGSLALSQRIKELLPI